MVRSSQPTATKQHRKETAPSFCHASVNNSARTPVPYAVRDIHSDAWPNIADNDESSDVTPMTTSALRLVDPGPVAPYVPTGREIKPAKALTH